MTNDYNFYDPWDVLGWTCVGALDFGHAASGGTP